MMIFVAALNPQIAPTMNPAKVLSLLGSSVSLVSTYGTGFYNLARLGDELFRLGLRNKRGGRVTRTGISNLLNNPFYLGMIRLTRTKETFQGIHVPLVSKRAFDRVHQVLQGNFRTRIHKHDFLFRRVLKCALCGYSLIGERQKGHTYYRCHTTGCSTASVRAELVEASLHEQLSRLVFNDTETG